MCWVFAQAMVGVVLVSEVLEVVGTDKYLSLMVVYMVVMVRRRVNML
jgi:hypothetical protein